MKLIPAIHRAPFRGCKHLRRTNLRQLLTLALDLAPIVKLQPQGSEPSAFQADTGEVIRRHNGFSGRGDVSCYFYQALLTTTYPPIDIKILRATFGFYSDLASTILPRIENMATGYSVDHDFRKRASLWYIFPMAVKLSSRNATAQILFSRRF